MAECLHGARARGTRDVFRLTISIAMFRFGCFYYGLRLRSTTTKRRRREKKKKKPSYEYFFLDISIRADSISPNARIEMD